ncbi:SpoU rRNA methylase [Diplocarpon rosae]|nr:SpoU rRNA methylase [Diplocarpon rosae]
MGRPERNTASSGRSGRRQHTEGRDRFQEAGALRSRTPDRSQTASRPFSRSSHLKAPSKSQDRTPEISYPSLSFQAKSRNKHRSTESTNVAAPRISGKYGSGGRSFFFFEQPRGISSDRTPDFKNKTTSGRRTKSTIGRLFNHDGKSDTGYSSSRNESGRSDTNNQDQSIKPGARPTRDAENPSERHDENLAVSKPHITHIGGRNIPLSITYTTPASEFLYGTSVVEAAMMSHRSPKRKLYKLYILTSTNREDTERDSRLERLARKIGVPVVRVGNDMAPVMDKMSSGRPHNGFILEASPLPRLPITQLGEFRSGSEEQEAGFEITLDYQSREEAAVNGTASFVKTTNIRPGRKPLVLLLDSIVDPGNLGGILRTAYFLGVSAIAISTRNSASFSPVVLKASAGASENVTLFSVKKPAGFIVDSKAAGWKVFAAVAPSKRKDPSMPEPISTDDLGEPLSEAPCILMLGSEGEGLRWILRSKADADLYIQGCGQSHNVDSLNVSVAAGILCNSFLRKDMVAGPTTQIAQEAINPQAAEEWAVGEETIQARGDVNAQPTSPSAIQKLF